MANRKRIAKRTQKMPTTPAEIESAISKQNSEKSEIEAELKTIKTSISELRTKQAALKLALKKKDKELARLESLKADADASAAQAAAREQIQTKVDELLSSGKSLQDIILLLNNEN